MNSVRRLDRAARFLFWALLLPPLARNLAGFAFGVTAIGSFLTIWQVLQFVGAFVILPAILMLLFAARDIVPHKKRIGVALLGMCAVELVFSVAPLLFPGVRSVTWFWLHRSAALVGVLLGAQLLRAIAFKFGEDGVARSLLIFMVGYILWQGVEWGWIQADPGFATQVAYLYLVMMLAETAIFFLLPGVWELILLHRFRKMLERQMRLVAGECVHCGYPLVGLTQPRCPECGRPAAIALPFSR